MPVDEQYDAVDRRGVDPVRRVVRELGWPHSVLLLWSARVLEPLLGRLDAAEVTVVRIAPSETADLLRYLDRVDLLLVDVEGFDDSVAAALTSLRETHPRLPVMLLTSVDSEAGAPFAAMRIGITQVVDPEDPASIDLVCTALQSRPASERALAIGAHPDDVEIGCAGTLLAHVARGDLVTVLTLSRGSVGGTAEQRRREARSASSAMSAQLLVADFIDTEIQSDPDLIRVIEHVVAEINPGTVYMHSANDTHQDHRAVHVATLSAARGVPRIFSYQSPSATNGFAPTKYVPIDQTVEGKVEVLSHYQSQAHRRYMDPDLVRAVARYWARQLPTGVVFAEPFEVLRTAEQSL